MAVFCRFSYNRSVLGRSGSFGGIVIVMSFTCKLHGLKYSN